MVNFLATSPITKLPVNTELGEFSHPGEIDLVSYRIVLRHRQSNQHSVRNTEYCVCEEIFPNWTPEENGDSIFQEKRYFVKEDLHLAMAMFLEKMKQQAEIVITEHNAKNFAIKEEIFATMKILEKLLNNIIRR